MLDSFVTPRGSGWDVFRSEMPLLCLVRPDVLGRIPAAGISILEGLAAKV